MLSDRLNGVVISETAKIKNLVEKKELNGERILSLSVGEPDFATPPNIIDAAKIAMDAGYCKYTHTSGMEILKKAVKQKLLLQNKLTYETDEIIISAGGKQVIFNAFFSTLNSNDEVIIPIPYWVSYPDIVRLCGGKPVFLTTKQSNNYKITPDDLNKVISRKTKWLIINSPSNPTGSIYNKTELNEICSLLKKYPKINILSDDIYENIIFDESVFHNIVQIDKSFKDRTLIVNGVSKGYAMTGWRLGYGAGSKKLVDGMTVIQSQSTSNASTISQHAAIEALSNSSNFIKRNKKVFQKRRDLVLNILQNAQNISFSKPAGAFYFFLSIEQCIGKKTKRGNYLKSDYDFALALLEETGVAVVAGSAFGSKNSVRISYAVSEKVLKEACTLLCDFCNNLS